MTYNRLERIALDPALARIEAGSDFPGFRVDFGRADRPETRMDRGGLNIGISTKGAAVAVRSAGSPALGGMVVITCFHPAFPLKETSGLVL